jgi:hypothetical protein
VARNSRRPPVVDSGTCTFHGREIPAPLRVQGRLELGWAGRWKGAEFLLYEREMRCRWITPRFHAGHRFGLDERPVPTPWQRYGNHDMRQEAVGSLQFDQRVTHQKARGTILAWVIGAASLAFHCLPGRCRGISTKAAAPNRFGDSRGQPSERLSSTPFRTFRTSLEAATFCTAGWHVVDATNARASL